MTYTLCGRKQRLTRKEAKIIARHGRHDYKVSPYRCARCGDWHVGGPKRTKEVDTWRNYKAGSAYELDPDISLLQSLRDNMRNHE